LSPTCARDARCSGVCKIELDGADADDGGDFVRERDVFAGRHRARSDEAIERRADFRIGERFFGLRDLRLYAVERRHRSGDHFRTLARGVGGCFILLFGGIDLRFGGFLLGARALQRALRNVAGDGEIGVALRVGAGHAGVGLRGFVVGAGGGDFGNFIGIERAALR
jgi:hypothetical protein